MHLNVVAVSPIGSPNAGDTPAGVRVIAHTGDGCDDLISYVTLVELAPKVGDTITVEVSPS